MDGQAQIRNLIRRTLEPLGAVILEAADGRAALAIEKLHAGSLSLAIVDFLIPGLNGLDLAAQLGRQTPSLKILYISSAAESVAIQA